MNSRRTERVIAGRPVRAARRRGRGSPPAPAPFGPTATPDPRVTAVPFSRLLKVELRKLVDTRAGFWLLAAIGIITVAVIAVFLFVAGRPS